MKLLYTTLISLVFFHINRLVFQKSYVGTLNSAYSEIYFKENGHFYFVSSTSSSDGSVTCGLEQGEYYLNSSYDTQNIRAISTGYLDFENAVVRVKSDSMITLNINESPVVYFKLTDNTSKRMIDWIAWSQEN